MNDFVEKWKTDSRFKAKTKLGLYTLFVIFVAIFAFANNPNPTLDTYETEYNENNDEISENQSSLNLSEKYNYIIDVFINNKYYKFEGLKTKEKETIKKIKDEKENNYIYENDTYYKENDGIYVITTKEEVYEPIKKNYIEIDTINQYLSKSTKENDKYIVYLKDIILGNDSNDYITISIETEGLNTKKTINIDYTMMMKNFDNNIEKYTVNIEIE